MDEKQYLLYLSHSWLPEHVDLNIALWDHLWAECRFLVDDNELENPPYFVSRIEDLIRRSDCFVAFAPPVASGSVSSGISPYVLFEIALAERAQLPRLVIVDKTVPAEGLLAGSPASPLLRVTFQDLLSGRGDGIWNAVREWLATVTAAAPPKDQVESHRAAVLLPEGRMRAEMLGAIEERLRQDGYTEVHDLRPASDVGLLRRLRQTDLLIADVGSMPVWDVYGLAHSAAVPTVRFALSSGADGVQLPAVLRGHAEGYDRDVIHGSTVAEVVSEISAHARAIRLPRVVVDSREEGREFFERRRGMQAGPAARS